MDSKAYYSVKAGAALAVVAALLGSSPAAQSPGRTIGSGGPVVGNRTLAIVNGRVFDATGEAVIDDGVVLVSGNRIVAAGAAAAVEVPEHAVVVDADGGLIMPGVIDNHVHLFPTFTSRLAHGEDIVTPWLLAGVTTLVDTGAVRHMVRAARALAESVAQPPRIFLAGPILTVPGGYPATRREQDIEMVAWPVEGPDDAYRTVARLIDREGVDLIKVAIETGFQTDYDEEGWPTLSMAELAAIARAAHERDVKVRAHVTNPGELQAAMEAGVDILAHTPIHPIPDELLREAADAGLIFISTANIWGSERGAPVPPNLYRYHQLGGTVVLGTDHPYQRGSQMPVAEMQLLTGAGLTPEEVLLSATRDGALALGLEAELGTLESGKLADVIVVAGDPLVDIAAMADVRIVMRDGEIVKGPAPLRRRSR